MLELLIRLLFPIHAGIFREDNLRLLFLLFFLFFLLLGLFFRGIAMEGRPLLLLLTLLLLVSVWGWEERIHELLL